MGAVEAHLAVHVVACHVAFDFDAGGQYRGDGHRGFDALQDEHGVVGVHNVHLSVAIEGRIGIHNVVHVVGEGYALRDLANGGFGVGCRGGQKERGHCHEDDE